MSFVRYSNIQSLNHQIRIHHKYFIRFWCGTMWIDKTKVAKIISFTKIRIQFERRKRTQFIYNLRAIGCLARQKIAPIWQNLQTMDLLAGCLCTVHCIYRCYYPSTYGYVLVLCGAYHFISCIMYYVIYILYWFWLLYICVLSSDQIG